MMRKLRARGSYRPLGQVHSLLILFLTLLLNLCARAYANEDPSTDASQSRQSPEQTLIELSRKHHHLPWRLEAGYLQYFYRSDLERLAQVLHEAQERSVHLVHIGDSHVQRGFQRQGHLRALQSRYPHGGPGLLFPYRTLKRRGPSHIKWSSTGTWECNHSMSNRGPSPFGLLGVSCLTHDSSATVQGTLLERAEVPIRNLTVLLEINRFISSVSLEVADHVSRREVTGEERSLTFTLPAHASSFTLSFEVNSKLMSSAKTPEEPRRQRGKKKRVTKQKKTRPKRRSPEETLEPYLSLRGFSLTNQEERGLVISAAGVGGANYQAPRLSKLLEDDMHILQPDIVLLDLGTNDILYTDMLPESLERGIRIAISKLRSARPDTVIILTTPGDLYRDGLNVISALEFGELVYKIAQEERCLVLDWFWFSGGPRSALKWRDHKYAYRDLVHLNQRGYQLKGQMMGLIIERTLDYYDPQMSPDHRLINRASWIEAANKLGAEPPQPPHRKKRKWRRHTIRPNETWSSIAKLHKIKEHRLRRWNRKVTFERGKRLKFKK